MCGILGGLNLDETKFNQGLDLMRHRGPDSTGVYRYNEDDAFIYLGMNRLAITGISTGEQPLNSKCGRIVLTFNGEIYNYREIWSSLAIDHEPRSDGDAIIELYLKYGSEGFKRLRGMYAISLYDKSHKKIYILRDWFGEKPLYIYNENRNLIWSSSIRAIVENLNDNLKYSHNSLLNYFRFTYIPNNETIYEKIFSLEPGKLHVYDTQGKLIESQKLKVEVTPNNSNIIDLLPNKIHNGLIGETGVGILLSGGIDSGLVASLSSHLLKRTKLKAFTISSNDELYDESQDAMNMSAFLKLDHEIIDFHKEFNADRFIEVVKKFDQPYADSSFIVSWTAFEFIKRNYPDIKVVLTGDGGDEIWGGYNKHKLLKLPKILSRLSRMLSRLFFLSGVKYLASKYFSLKVYKVLKAFTWSSKYMGILSLGFDSYTIKRLFGVYKDEFTADASSLQEAIELDHNFSLLYDLNVKTDQASMFNSIEARSPLLDLDLYETNKVNFVSKRKVALAYAQSFPKGYIEKPKRGFAFNLSSFLLNDFREYSLKYLEASMLKKIPGLNVREALEIVDEFKGGSDALSFEVYSLIIASIWFDSKEYV